jgi:hypothetical protein
VPSRQTIYELEAGPFCQVSTTPSPLPQGLRDPPEYLPPLSSSCSGVDPLVDELPTYESATQRQTTNENGTPPQSSKTSGPAEDVLHFLDVRHDTLISLSLQYGIPISALRRANRIWSDNLLHARRTLIIPGQFYKAGISLSPRPIDGEEGEIRKCKVRRLMVACKVSE